MFCIFARIFCDVHIALKVVASVEKAAGSCGGSPQTVLAIPGTLDLGNLNIKMGDMQQALIAKTKELPVPLVKGRKQRITKRFLVKIII